MREKRRASFSLYISIAAIVLILVLLSFGQLRKPFEVVSEPVLSVGYSIGQWFRSIPRPFEDTTTLLNQIETYEQQNQQLVRENTALKALLEERDIEQSIQNFLSSITEQGITAHVIGKPGGVQELLLIDKGSEDGVQKGQAVITEQGFLIGTIYEVTSGSAHILLLTDSSQSVAAKIQNEASSPGVVRGEFGLSLLMDLIPQNDTVEKNQTVVTSALEPLIPPQLVIGTVSSVVKTEGEIFQQAKITSPVHPDRVELVSVIISRHD